AHERHPRLPVALSGRRTARLPYRYSLFLGSTDRIAPGRQGPQTAGPLPIPLFLLFCYSCPIAYSSKIRRILCAGSPLNWSKKPMINNAGLLSAERVSNTSETDPRNVPMLL